MTAIDGKCFFVTASRLVDGSVVYAQGNTWCAAFDAADTYDSEAGANARLEAAKQDSLRVCNAYVFAAQATPTGFRLSMRERMRRDGADAVRTRCGYGRTR